MSVYVSNNKYRKMYKRIMNEIKTIVENRGNIQHKSSSMIIVVNVTIYRFIRSDTLKFWGTKVHADYELIVDDFDFRVSHGEVH